MLQLIVFRGQANLAHATAYGFFATDAGEGSSTAAGIAVSEQDVRDVGIASGLAADEAGTTSTGYRLRKRRAINKNPESRAAMLLHSGMSLPEPTLDFETGGGGVDRIITLRIRALRKQEPLPVFAEGDVIIGMTEALGARRNKESGEIAEDGPDPLLSSSSSSSDDGEDEEDSESSRGEVEEQEGGELQLLTSDEARRRKRRRTGRRTRSHTNVFRVCAVYWGTKAYVNMMVDGNGAAGQSAMAAGRATAGQNCFAVCRLVKAG